MFADLLTDSPWANRSHRGWTTLASFAAQAVVAGSLLLLPLLYTSGLPHLHLMGPLLAPAPPPAPLPPQPSRATSTAQSNLSNGELIGPSQIPPTVSIFSENNPPPAPDLGGIQGGTGDRWSNHAVFSSIRNNFAAVAPPPAPPVVRQPRVSRMMEGNVIRRVQPEYPVTARIARVQGTVVLHAIIGKDGAIKELQAVSGPPLLVGAAIDAVRQWRYRPYFLNDEPVEVDTQVTVNFVLGGV